MNTLTIKQKRVIENNNITVEMIEQGEDTGYIFLIAGCYNQQKPKTSEKDAYLSAINFIMEYGSEKTIEYDGGYFSAEEIREPDIDDTVRPDQLKSFDIK